ncbi:hypothetical protein V2J09_020703 [Rumex salicifolius]
MAALTTQSSSPSSPLLSPLYRQHRFTLPSQRVSFNPRNPQRDVAMNCDLLNGLGGRDPFPAEIASKFGEKVLGNMNTEHKILIPQTSVLSLAKLDPSPISPSQPPMSLFDAKSMLCKVVGWRLLDEEDGLKLQCTWKVKDSQCGVELISRITKLAEAVGHFPSLRLEEPNQVIAELWTPSIGGLSINDFILAAKIDEVKTLDLVPRKRAWA